MAHDIIDSLYQLLDTLQSSSRASDEERQDLILSIIRAINERRGVTESSNKATCAIASASPFGEPSNPRDHALLHSPELFASHDAGRSQILELMRHQIDAVTGAQIQALSRQSPAGTPANPSPRLSPDTRPRPCGAPMSRSESVRTDASQLSDLCRLPDAHDVHRLRSHESSQTDPVIFSTVAQHVERPSPPQEEATSRDAEYGREIGATAPLEPQSSVEDAATGPTTAAPITSPEVYRPLSSVTGDLQSVNMYVVAVEMIRVMPRSEKFRYDMVNYKVIDPSVHGETHDADPDYSLLLLVDGGPNQFHVSFGDIIRLRRVDTTLRVDKSGKQHINIYGRLHKYPAMRLWRATEWLTRPDPLPSGPDGASETQAPADASHESEAEALERLRSEAVVLFQEGETRVYREDLEHITRLREWVRRELNVFDLTIRPKFRRKIAEAGPEASDFVVCVLEVSPEPAVNLVVSDESSMAVLTRLNDILVSNLLESSNSIKPGDWLKVKSVQRARQPFKRADGTTYVELEETQYTCVTRLPPCSLPYVKPIPPSAPRSKKARRVTRMRMWNAASGLNRSFPRHLFGSTGYVDRLLQYNYSEEGSFERVPRSADEEPEEGEIQPGALLSNASTT
ncbi:aminotransferase class III, putative [Babesia caballi]|uniref:Aminotransferase class III, putative n=1 Tax=Babesia caballi TaxID=5871 RepID=A0AAV4LVW7_BABCB|nr:aminotransferase class III, putative [Babesia caballi]